MKLNSRNPITKGITLLRVAGDGQPTADYLTGYTYQRGLVPFPSDFGIQRIQTDAYPDVISDGGSVIGDHGSLLWLGIVKTGLEDFGLVGNRSDTSANWSLQLQVKKWNGSPAASLQFYGLSSAVERIIRSSANFVQDQTPLLSIGSFRADDLVLMNRKPGTIERIDNSGVGYTLDASTTPLAINTYFDNSADRTLNGDTDSGGFALAVAWDRGLTDTEMESLIDNPWQLLAPQRFFVPVYPYDATVIEVEAPAGPTLTITLVDAAGTTLPNLTGLSWAWFDESTVSTMTAPTAQGTGETTDASGVLEIDITGTTLGATDTGILTLRDSTGHIYALYRVTLT
jgi:hypothetical protein